MKKLIDFGIPVLLFVLAITFYVLTLRGEYGNLRPENIKNNLDKASKPFELSPERGRYILTYSLATNHSFGLSRQLADAADPDVGYHEGKFYIFFPPGISILALPLFNLGAQYNLAQLGAFFTISIFAAFNLVFIYLIAKNVLKISTGLSFFAAWVFGFGSTSWSYAITLYQHHTTTFLILSSFYFLWAANKKDKFQFLASFYTWLAYGVGIWVDYPNAILMLPVMIYMVLTNFKFSFKRNLLESKIQLSVFITSIAFIGLIVLHGYYNYVNFGSPTTLSGSLPGIKHLIENEKKTKEKSTTTEFEDEFSKDVVRFFREEDVPTSFTILSVAEDKGIFVFSPIFILSLFGVYMYLKNPKVDGGILLATSLMNIFLYSSWSDPWGGWAFGPRYLIISMAVLSIFVSYFLQNIKYYWLPRIIALVLFVYSAAIALLGALTSNQVPPKIEAVFLKMKFGYFLTFDYLKEGLSGSYVFNTYFAKHMTLINYFIFIFIAVYIIALIALFSISNKISDETDN